MSSTLASDLNTTGLASDQSLNAGLKQQQFQQAGAAPVQTIQRDAALVEEKIHHKETQHLQQVITRDIEQTEVHQVQQPVHESQIEATTQSTKVLAEEHLEQNYDRGVPQQLLPQAVRVEGEGLLTQVTHAPLVEERVHKTIIEEVQPLLYRDVIKPHETLVVQPISEKIREAPVVIQETRPMVEAGGLGLGLNQNQQGLSSGLGLNSGLSSGLGQQGLNNDLSSGLNQRL